MAQLRFNPFVGNFDYVGGGGREVIPAICLATDEVGHCVHSRGTRTGNVLWVEAASIYDVDKMPALGIIISKSSATACRVRLFGEHTSSGLIPGKIHFIGQDSRITATRPTATSMQYAMIQVIGYAVDAEILHLNPAPIMIKVVP